MSLPKGSIINTPFLMLQAHPDDFKKYKTIKDDITKIFFHKKNIEIIQNGLIKEVYKISNGKYLICKQNEIKLTIIMKGILINHDGYKGNNVRDNIKELNNIVINELVPVIISEIEMKDDYENKIFGETEIMDHPVNVSNKGKKYLRVFN